MRIRLRGAANTADQQQDNDRKTQWRLLGMFGVVMLAYAYLLTHLGTTLGLPEPAELFGGVASSTDFEFDDDGNVDSHLYIQTTDIFNNDDARLILFTVITGAFISGYFLPLKLKRPSFAVWFLAGFGLLYGLTAAAMLLTGHLLAYLVLHGPHIAPHKAARISLAFGALAMWLFGSDAVSFAALPPAILAAAVASWRLFHYVVNPIQRKNAPIARIMRSVVMHAPLLTVFCGIAVEGITETRWHFPIGILILLFQWARLISYHIDFRDGEVPKDLGLMDYLSVFLSPAVIPNHRYAPYLAQGYSYLNTHFYSRDKNQIIAGGLRLYSLALFYLCFADYAVDWFIDWMEERWDTPVYEFISVMVRAYCRGEPMSTPTVLISTMLDQWRIFLIYGAVTHFKVATWRVLGYQVDPQYNRPWLATNLANLWSRFAFHYREFLVRAVYYPVFFRCFKSKTVLRMFTAIMIATIIGNPFWGHTPAKLLANGITWDRFYRMILRSWPYYVLLGSGISISHIYLMGRVRTRKPWTLDSRLPLDFLCSYLTFQYFSLIHIFIRPQHSSTLTDHIKLFLIGLGIHLE